MRITSIGECDISGNSKRVAMVLMVVAAAVWPQHVAGAAEPVPTKVVANYGISYAGVDIGDFQFNSAVGEKVYELAASSQVKLLFGAFKWSSRSHTKGTIGRAPTPTTFDLTYNVKKKVKRSSIEFARGSVVAFKNTPPVNPSPDHVALNPKRLAGVIDPMTAIVRMTLDGQGGPCTQSAEIFEGRLHMRLTLTPKGRRPIQERTKSGQPTFGYVCRIKFTPIAGHKKGSDINYLADNDDIEIILRPVPSANLMVPYRILVPTRFGTVAITARSVNIDSGNKQRIAMRY